MGWRGWAAVSLYFLIATLVLTWPAALRLGDSVIGPPGDHLHFAYLIDWFDRALFEQQRSPYFVPQLNYPEGWHAARSETTPLQAVLAAPLRRLGGTLFAYNTMALLSFTFTGLATFVWLHHLTGQAWPGIIAGTVYAFSPFRVAHYRVGHLNVLGTMAFPLFFMGLLIALSGETGRRRGAVLAGLALGAVSLISQYYFYVTVVAGAALALAYLFIYRRRELLRPVLWGDLSLLVAVAAPFAALGSFPYLQLSLTGDFPDRSVFELSRGSASASDFVLPSTDHFLWGSWVGENFSRNHWVEGSLYLGLPAAILAGIAIWSSRRQAARRRRIVLGLIGLALSGVLISLGTHLFWNETLVRADLPAWLGSLLGRDATAIPMPGYFLVKYLPFYDRMRTFKRAGALALLGVSVLAGLGAAQLLNRLSARARHIGGLALLAVAILDLYPGAFREFTPIEARPVDRWLASQPGEGAVAEFPFHLEEDQLHVYYTLTHGKPFLGGFFNAFPPPQYVRIRPAMGGFPDETSIGLLRDLDVRYVLVHPDSYPDSQDWPEGLSSLGLELAFEAGGVMILVLEPEP